MSDEQTAVKEYPHMHFTQGVNYGQVSDGFKDAMVMYAHHTLAQREWHRVEGLNRDEIEQIVVTYAYAGAVSHCGLVEVPLGYILENVKIVWTSDATISESYSYGAVEPDEYVSEGYDELAGELNTESVIQ